MSQGLPNTNVQISTSSKVTSIYPGDNAAADEGSFFTATNPTPGTGIATTLGVVDDAATQSSTHGQASPVLYIQNQNSVASQYNIYLRYLRMVCTTIPTSATIWNYSFRLDNLSNKLTTAGTVLTPNGTNPSTTARSQALINVGTITTVIMSANGRLVACGQVSGTIPVLYDEWYFNFGAPAAGIDSIGTTTLMKRLSFPIAPIVIPPGWALTMAMFGASNATTPAFTYDIGYIERPAGQ